MSQLNTRFSILKRGDPILNQVSAPVQDVTSVKSTIAALSHALTEVQKLYNFQRGSGISAPQLGILQRVSVVEYDGHRRVLINPEIIDHSSDKVATREGCLSFFNYRGNVLRYDEVTIKALDENGHQIEFKASGNFAMLLQHEIDHLDGILYVQRLPKEDKDLYLVEDMPSIP